MMKIPLAIYGILRFTGRTDARTHAELKYSIRTEGGACERAHTVAVAGHVDSVDCSVNESVIRIAFRTSSDRVTV